MRLESEGLAVIAAMEPEAHLVRGRLRHSRRPEVLKVGRFWRGQAGAQRVVLGRCGMGEERAAGALQWLVEHERLWGVVSIGFAGGLQPELATGDVVLANRLLAWTGVGETIDTRLEGGSSAGPEPGTREAKEGVVTPNAQLEALAASAAQRAGLTRHQGLLLSHKALVPGALDKRMLGRYTGALAVDMESYRLGAIAQAYDLPFISMRAVLDPCDLELGIPLDGLTTHDGGVRPSGAAMAAIRNPRIIKSFWELWCLSRLTQRRLGTWLDSFFALLDSIPREKDAQRP